jgi:hypothetical protein
MTVKLVDATISSFGSVFEKFKAEAPKNKVNLILFLADNDPSTNLSWCPGKCFFFFFWNLFLFLARKMMTRYVILVKDMIFLSL